MKKAFFTSLIFTTILIFGFGTLGAAEELSLLTWSGYAPQALVEKFQKETGITVKVTKSNNEEMIAKLRATGGGGFDLAQPSQDRIADSSALAEEILSAMRIVQAIQVELEKDGRGAAVAVVDDQGAAGVEHVIVGHTDDSVCGSLHRRAGRRGSCSKIPRSFASASFPHSHKANLYRSIP